MAASNTTTTGIANVKEITAGPPATISSLPKPAISPQAYSVLPCVGETEDETGEAGGRRDVF
jgi:hypothetical protein